jgi:hypothetical protein
MNNSDEEKFNAVISNIIRNYEQLEKSIVSQLFLDVPNHRLTEGVYREQIWKSLFEQIIPKKFAIEQGIFIIDSHGKISREVDLAIFDEQYTPYIFNYGQIRFIPIEAVAVVIQCKSKTINNDVLKNLREWVDSIDALKTDTRSVVRIFTGFIDNDIEEKIKREGVREDVFKTQTATRPIKILCHLKEDGNEQVKGLFDILLEANNENLKITSDCRDLLNDWHEHLNHAQPGKYDSWIKPKGDMENKLSDLAVSNNGKESSLLTLIFQLNQLLMIINNPMLFPHKAYVEMFKGRL